MAVELRRLTPNDVDAIAFFESEIAKVSFPEQPITDLKFYAKKIERLLGDKEATTFVADDGGTVVGWAYVSKRQNFITREAYADFHSIYVSPSQRGTGLVSRLVQGVFDWCKEQGFDRVVFRTRATNEPMKSVLTRSGFVPTQIYYEKSLADDAEGIPVA